MTNRPAARKVETPLEWRKPSRWVNLVDGEKARMATVKRFDDAKYDKLGWRLGVNKTWRPGTINVGEIPEDKKLHPRVEFVAEDDCLFIVPIVNLKAIKVLRPVTKAKQRKQGAF